MNNDGQMKLTCTLETALRARNRGLLGQERFVRTAVLVPLIKRDDIWFVLFEERAKTLRRQAGEICFPGGHCDNADADEEYTALRETCEELGILTEQVELLGPLDVLMASTELLVYPFVGVIHTSQLRPNPAEVESVFEVSLPTLLEYKPQVHDVPLIPQPKPDFPYHLIPGGQNYAWRTSNRRQWFYEVENHVIWGLTARILTHFLNVVREIQVR